MENEIELQEIRPSSSKTTGCKSGGCDPFPILRARKADEHEELDAADLHNWDWDAMYNAIVRGANSSGQTGSAQHGDDDNDDNDDENSLDRGLYPAARTPSILHTWDWDKLYEEIHRSPRSPQPTTAAVPRRLLSIASKATRPFVVAHSNAIRPAAHGCIRTIKTTVVVPLESGTKKMFAAVGAEMVLPTAAAAHKAQEAAAAGSYVVLGSVAAVKPLVSLVGSYTVRMKTSAKKALDGVVRVIAEPGMPFDAAKIPERVAESRKRRRRMLRLEAERERPRPLDGHVDYDDVTVLMVRWGSYRLQKGPGGGSYVKVESAVPEEMYELQEVFHLYSFKVRHFMLESDSDAPAKFVSAVREVLWGKTKKSLVILYYAGPADTSNGRGGCTFKPPRIPGARFLPNQPGKIAINFNNLYEKELCAENQDADVLCLLECPFNDERGGSRTNPTFVAREGKEVLAACAKSPSDKWRGPHVDMRFTLCVAEALRAAMTGWTLWTAGLGGLHDKLVEYTRPSTCKPNPFLKRLPVLKSAAAAVALANSDGNRKGGAVKAPPATRSIHIVEPLPAREAARLPQVVFPVHYIELVEEIEQEWKEREERERAEKARDRDVVRREREKARRGQESEAATTPTTKEGSAEVEIPSRLGVPQWSSTSTTATTAVAGSSGSASVEAADHNGRLGKQQRDAAAENGERAKVEAGYLHGLRCKKEWDWCRIEADGGLPAGSDRAPEEIEMRTLQGLGSPTPTRPPPPTHSGSGVQRAPRAVMRSVSVYKPTLAVHDQQQQQRPSEQISEDKCAGSFLESLSRPIQGGGSSPSESPYTSRPSGPMNGRCLTGKTPGTQPRPVSSPGALNGRTAHWLVVYDAENESSHAGGIEMDTIDLGGPFAIGGDSDSDLDEVVV